MDSSPLIAQLQKLLAENYVTMLKYHNYHWNVTGPHFVSYHQHFQAQYETLFEAVDEIAENIRQYRVPTIGTMKQYLALSDVSEIDAMLHAPEMISDLHKAHDILMHTIKEALASADQANDEAVIDLLNQQLAYHSKQTWMLESLMQS